MPGLCCIISSDSTQTIAEQLDLMVQSMCHFPTYTINTLSGEGVGLAAVNIDSRFAIQPVDTDDLLVVCYGYIFLRDGTAGQYAFANPHIAGEIAQLYRRHNERFIDYIEGKFLIALYDKRACRLLLVNDRRALVPLYYYQTAETFYAATEMKAIQLLVGESCHIDHVAMQEFLLFEYPLRDRTFFQEIRHLPFAHVLSRQEGTTRLERYWDISINPSRQDLSLEDAAEQADALLSRSMRRGMNPALRSIYPLSGGLDSRFICLYALRHSRDVPTITYGSRGSNEIKYATAFAQAMGLANQQFNHDPQEFAIRGPRFVWRTDGMCGIQNAHAEGYLHTIAGQYDLRFTGCLGDLVAGNHMHPHPADATPQQHAELLLEGYGGFRKISPFLRQQIERVFDWDAIRHDLWLAACDGLRNNSSDNLHEYFLYSDKGPRNTILLEYGTNTWLENYHPFMDYDYFDFMLSVNPQLRRKQLLYRYLLAAKHPPQASTPFSSSGGLRYNAGSVAKLKAKARTYERHWKYGIELASLGKLHWRMSSYQHTYDRWLRSELRVWKERYVASAMTRGWMSAPFVERVMQLQQLGIDHQYIFLYNLITLELFGQQQFQI